MIKLTSGTTFSWPSNALAQEPKQNDKINSNHDTN